MTTRHMERNRTCTCQQCGETFESVRYNAEFCSPRCRKRRQRELEEIDKHLAAALYIIEALRKSKGRVGEDKAYQAIKKIAARAVWMRDYWD